VRAYVDESVREAAPGWYVLAAVLVPPARADAIRAALRCGPPGVATPRGGWRRYHWHGESPRSRRAMAAYVGSLGLDAIAIVASGVQPRRPERARRHCLLRLLWELHERGVCDVLLESRFRLDESDRRLIGHAQRAGQVDAALRYAFERPGNEPLLWPADVVAGAVARAVADGDASFLDALGAVRVVTLP
jgi:hypothetical protein